jgi:hypothetical protein
MLLGSSNATSKSTSLSVEATPLAGNPNNSNLFTRNLLHAGMEIALISSKVTT